MLSSAYDRKQLSYAPAYHTASGGPRLAPQKEELGDRRDAGLLLGGLLHALLRGVSDEALQPTIPLPVSQQNFACLASGCVCKTPSHRRGRRVRMMR